MTKARLADEDAEYFQRRRNDPAEWTEDAEKVRARPRGSVVYSVRFSPDELSDLRRLARFRGVTLSELIRSSVVQHARETDQPSVQASAPVLKFYARMSPPRIGTRGSETQKIEARPRAKTAIAV